MRESIHFHTELYRRDALELVAEQYRVKARIELADAGPHVVAHVEPLAQDAPGLFDEFCNAAFSLTARHLRDSGGAAADEAPVSDAPPWGLLAPFGEGTPLGLGWVLDSLSPARQGAATLVLRHDTHGTARVAVRRNGGAPLGVAHTEQLDFMLMNGGSGAAMTEPSIGAVLGALAKTLRARGPRDGDAALLAALQPHAERQAPQGGGRGEAARPAQKRLSPQVDLDAGTIAFEFDEAGVSRLAWYDAVLAFADRCYVFLTRPEGTRIGVRLRPRGETAPEALRALAADVTRALNHVLRGTGGSAGGGGLPLLPRRREQLDQVLAELAAADPTTVGLGAQPERGPGHENLRVLNLRGTGACDSECLFCIEKFNPSHRPMPNADATRQLILDSAGKYDMLFFASGEPTIHPKLFEYVDLARSVGFTCFGMSSHFRTFADPHFALRTLQAGFEYFDIALHAADTDGQLAVNPIDDEGRSLWEALQGLANLLRLADVLGMRISITHKIVVSRLNVTRLEAVFRATYDRGVRHIILQPVRSLGLAPDRQAALEIAEEEILPHLNAFLRNTEGLGAVIKPYGFARAELVDASHIETEQNRVKNIYGKIKAKDLHSLPTVEEERPTDGRHWVQVREQPDGQFAFAATGERPILDEALRRGRNLNFGCRMASCGMCAARLIEGRVDQSTQIFLTEEQVAAGYVLLCQAKPLSDVVVQVCTNEEIDEL